MKKLFIFIPIFLILVILFTIISPSIEVSESISQKVFRLHILANSDSEEDQTLKLKVRDEVLKLSKDIYKECNNIKDAINSTEENKDLIYDTARKVITDNRYSYNTKVIITKEYFNTREYDGFTMPAGIYNCVKIVIGEGKGKNWWCVMFPQVCLSGCTDDFEGYLTEDEKEMLTSGGYKVRFRIIEIIERLKQKI